MKAKQVFIPLKVSNIFKGATALSNALSKNKLVSKVVEDPIFFLAFGFGSGLLPYAPGTWGTIAAFPLYLLLALLPVKAYLIIIFLLFILGIFLCNTVSQQLKENDYPGIVWDEIIGYLITMAGAPLGFGWMLLGFILFRLFDIWKPQPIHFIEKHVEGGLGVMIDDLLAAIPALLLLQLTVWILHQ